MPHDNSSVTSHAHGSMSFAAWSEHSHTKLYEFSCTADSTNPSQELMDASSDSCLPPSRAFLPQASFQLQIVAIPHRPRSERRDPQRRDQHPAFSMLLCSANTILCHA